jgi:hypothetical protein
MALTPRQHIAVHEPGKYNESNYGKKLSTQLQLSAYMPQHLNTKLAPSPHEPWYATAI